MALRPKQMRWFEVYVPRHETVRALGVLARTGKVELDTNPKVNTSLEIGEIRAVPPGRTRVPASA